MCRLHEHGLSVSPAHPDDNDDDAVDCPKSSKARFHPLPPATPRSVHLADAIAAGGSNPANDEVDFPAA